MHEIETTLALFRGIERLLIQAGAILCVVLGTLLYRWGVKGKSDAELGGASFTFKLSGAAPGSILGLFGMAIMLVGLFNPLRIDDPVDEPASCCAASAPRGGDGGVPDAGHAVAPSKHATSILYSEQCTSAQLEVVRGLQQLQDFSGASAKLAKWQKAAEATTLAAPHELVARLRNASAPSESDAERILRELHDLAQTAECKAP